jgi:uncharacterized repeat protein (TIGR01451 family)
MRRPSVVAAIAAVASLFATAATAHAATTLGQTFTPDICGSSPFVLTNTATTGNSYAAPADGVLTQWSVQGGVETDQVQLAVIQHLSGTQYNVKAKSAVETIQPGQLATLATRLPIQAGQYIAYQGVATTGGFGCLRNEPGDTLQYCSTACNPSAGQDVNLDSSEPNVRTNISARLEPDADRDGYGDESQDSCPADATRFASACDTNIAVAKTVSPATVAPTENALYTVTVSNPGTGTAQDVVLSDMVPAGLGIVSVNTTRGGPCTVADRQVTCNMGTLQQNENGRVDIAVRAQSPGAPVNTASATTSTPDSDPSNNSASATLNIVDPIKPGKCANSRTGTSAKDVLTGTTGGDNLFGLQGADVIEGLLGDDCLFGGPGNDRLSGDDGSDKLYGEDGNDNLIGGRGNDTLNGGNGRDKIAGGEGTNKISGGAGNDTINAVNGKTESVNCGAGKDVARLDKRDAAKGCERQIRSKK